MRNVNPALYAYFQRKGIAVEAMATAHAIAAFRVLVAEGRQAVAGLIARSPVPRDEACLYTPDYDAMMAAAPNSGDARVHAALAGPAVSGGGVALLEAGEAGAAGGSGGAAGGGAAPAPSPAHTLAAAPGAAAAAKAAAQQRAAWEATSASLATRYGVPDAASASVDVSPLHPSVNPGAAARVAHAAAVTRPRTAEDLDAAQLRKSSRRSSGQHRDGAATGIPGAGAGAGAGGSGSSER
jgi:hypothetical protein